MNENKLITMSNQIAGFFQSYPHEKAVNGIAEHIGKFWDKKMRQTILEHSAAGGSGLEPLVIEALNKLKLQSHS